MMETVQVTLDENSTIWSSVPVIVKVKNNLDEIIQRVEELNEKAGNSSRAETITKDTLRNSLMEKIPMLAGQIYVLGTMNNDEGLKQTGSVKRNDILRARETDMEALVSPIISTAKENLDKLKDMGVTADLISEAATTLDSFKAHIGQPRNILNKVYASKSGIDELIDEAMTLHKEQLDKLMLMYQYTKPDFYEQYKRARVIVD
ncbi:MAG: hypothetical protein JXB49_03945 [Bacteroidales bacterium]|nr:hypothetical protein [Bacteroidales bacterium]